MGMCLECVHWQGNREKTLQDIKEHGDIVINWLHGWPEWGGCGRSYEWLDVEIKGDATVTCTVPANFGCFLFEEI